MFHPNASMSGIDQNKANDIVLWVHSPIALYPERVLKGRGLTGNCTRVSMEFIVTS